MRLPVSTLLCDEALEGAVAGGVVDVVVVPQAPDHAAPGAAEDADRVLVTGAALDRAVVVYPVRRTRARLRGLAVDLD